MSQFNRPPFASSQCPVSVSRLNPSPLLFLNGVLVCVSERPVWGAVIGLQGSDGWAALLVWSQWGSRYSPSRGLTSLFAAGSHSALWGWHWHASSLSLQHQHKLSTDSCFSSLPFSFFLSRILKKNSSSKNERYHYSLTYIIPNLYDFFLWNTKEDMFRHIMKVNRIQIVRRPKQDFKVLWN